MILQTRYERNLARRATKWVWDPVLRWKTAQDVRPMPQKSLQARGSCARRSYRSSTGTIDAPTIALEQANGFGIFMLKAVLSGRGDKIVDLAKVNLFR